MGVRPSVALAIGLCACHPPPESPPAPVVRSVCLAEARGQAAKGMIPWDDDDACEGGWEACLERCGAGDGPACFRASGALVASEDMGCAAELRELGCDAGDVASCAWLARQLVTGAGVEADRDRGAELARRACDGGDGFGCVVMASLADAPARKAEWAGRGCRQGSAAACRIEGWMRLRGEGIPRDVEVAAERFDRACRGDDGEGCVMLGRIAIAPPSGAPRPGAAVIAFERGCALGAPDGCVQAAFCHDGRCGLARPLAGEVEPLLRRGCEGGAPVACTYLASRLYDRADPSLHPEALALARRACDAKEALGCRLAGQMRARGEGAEVDVDDARDLLGRACELGSPRACQLSLSEGGVSSHRARLEAQCAEGVPRACPAMAFVRWHGLGGDVDREGALEVARRECEEGKRESCAKLASFALEAWDDEALVELVERPVFDAVGLRFVRGIALSVAGRHLDAERALLAWAASRPDLHAQAWIALNRVAQEVSYEPELRDALASSTEWPAPIARYLLRQRPAEDLLAEAAQGSPAVAAERRCEAAFFAGFDAYLSGRSQEARRWLEVAVETDVRRFVEWAAARALLRRLDLAKPP